MKNQTGTVFWLTGLSGSGKTTIGTALAHHLRSQALPVIFLDGDHLREITGNVFGHDSKQRLQASMLYGRLCKMLAEQNIHVVCATISLFHQVQNWNRENISHYIEVFVDVPFAEIVSRDPKKIYSRAQAGELSNVVGIDVVPEYPINPDIIIHNTNNSEIQDTVQEIMRYFNSAISELDI